LIEILQLHCVALDEKEETTVVFDKHIIKEQLLVFVESNGILCSEQSGFRSSFTCETDLNLVVDQTGKIAIRCKN
jgi:hypothetical protein